MSLMENIEKPKKEEYPKVNDVYERIRKRREELNIKF